VVETLARTGGFSVSVAKRRMFETTQHILQVTQSLASIQPGGAGHASSIRVRLLHAAVRRRILKLEKERPGYYSVEEYGIPINDLDSIATIGTFSATLIWLGLPRQGIYLTSQETTDFIALWRLVALYVGTPTAWFETPEKAKVIMESILISEISPTETSKVLANNIITSLQDTPPTYASRDFLCASARWLNGHELADRLGLDRPGFYYYALMAGQCIFFVVMCYTYRSVPSWDRKKITALKGIFYHIIVEKESLGLGKPTNFDFQYIPGFEVGTERGVPPERTNARGVERRNLKTLLIAGTVVGLGIWMSTKTFRGIMKVVFS
jgi:hypothetical protein